jgi:anti-sigma factor RsiW
MTESLDFPPAVEADLVALADDCLSRCCRSEVEARIAADVALTAALEDQRRALSLLAAAAPRPSLALRSRVAELAAAAPAPSRRRVRPATSAPAAAAIGVLAAVAMLLAAVLGPPARSSPTSRGESSAPSGLARPPLHQIRLSTHGAPEAPRIRPARLLD